EHAPAGGVAEDEVCFVAKAGALELLQQRDGYSLGERDGAVRAPRLRCSELAARVGAADADHSRVVIDVLPAQGKQLAPAQACHRRGQVERALRLPERIIGCRGQNRVELGDAQMTDLWLAPV